MNRRTLLQTALAAAGIAAVPKPVPLARIRITRVFYPFPSAAHVEQLKRNLEASMVDVWQDRPPTHFYKGQHKIVDETP